MDLNLTLKTQIGTKLILNQMLRRSLEILELPQLELAALIAEEIDQNPLLEIKSNSSLTAPSYIFPDPPAKPSLYEHLQAQIREAFPKEQKRVMEILSHLDERGFLSAPLETSFLPERLEEVLHILQTFDPPGIFARNVREAFLLQLRGQEESLAFRLVKDTFEDFLKGRYTALKKKFQVSESTLREAIQKLKTLSTRPAASFQTEISQAIHPDLVIRSVDSKWVVESNDDALPDFQIKPEYLHLPSLSSKEKQTVRMFVASARWLSRSIQRRRKLLLSIGAFLVRHLGDYFEGKRSLDPIPMRELAIEFGVHESTISRAILNKYVEGPHGLMPLKAFVSSYSNHSAKEVLLSIISQEDSPLTDDQLMEKMREAGLPIARRTVAKYRKQMKIGSSSVRKHTR